MPSLNIACGDPEGIKESSLRCHWIVFSCLYHELRQLREENTKRKRLVADLSPNRHQQQEIVEKNFEVRIATQAC